MRLPRFPFPSIVVSAVLSIASCRPAPEAQAPSAPAAPVAAAAAAPAEPAPAAAPAPATPAPAAATAAPAPAGPLWPDPLPSGWKLLDDFEKGDPKANLWGGYVGTWGFRGGQCKVEVVREDGSGRQKVSWSLPAGDSQCGTLSQFAGPKGKPKPVDISAYDRVVFLVMSGDGEPHKLRFEVVELDPYDAALQGYTGDLVVTAGSEWQRVEVRLDQVLHPMFDRKKGRQVGLRLDRKETDASGVIVLDNLAFVAKGAK